MADWRSKLRYYRKKIGKTQGDVALHLNTSQQTIVNWEKEGGTNPSIDELYKFTKFLGISMNDLFEEDDSLTIAAEPEGVYKKLQQLEGDVSHLKQEILQIKKQTQTQKCKK